MGSKNYLVGKYMNTDNLMTHQNISLEGIKVASNLVLYIQSKNHRQILFSCVIFGTQGLKWKKYEIISNFYQLLCLFVEVSNL